METIKQKVKELNSIIEKVNDGEKEFIKMWYKDPKEVQEVFLNALYKNYEDIIKKNKEEKKKEKEYNVKAEKEWDIFEKETIKEFMEEEWFKDMYDEGEDIFGTLCDEGEIGDSFEVIAIYLHYKNEFKKKFMKEQEKKNKPKSTKRKNSGGRSRKNMDGTEEVYINNESSKEQLIEDYKLIKQGKKVGYFMPDDDGRVYLKYVKRLTAEKKDKHPTTNEDIEEDVIIKKWVNCIKTTSFGTPVEDDDDRCDGAVKWADGVGNGDETGSKYCYDNEIYTMPMVLCSKKKVGGNGLGKSYCKSCSNKKGGAITYNLGKYSGKAGEGDKGDEYDDYFLEYIGCNKIGNVVGYDKGSSDEEIIDADYHKESEGEEEDKK